MPDDKRIYQSTIKTLTYTSGLLGDFKSKKHLEVCQSFQRFLYDIKSVTVPTRDHHF